MIINILQTADDAISDLRSMFFSVFPVGDEHLIVLGCGMKEIKRKLVGLIVDSGVKLIVI
jgi:hypothetical protein